MQSELPVGSVTTADLYRKLEMISDGMIRVDERIKVLPDLEARVRLLERFRWSLMGASATIGILSGAISAVLAVLLSGGH